MDKKKIDSIYDFTDRGLVELKQWLEPWFRQKQFAFPGLPSLSELITGSTGLSGFWKLNETTGTTASDSSGNGYHMSPPATVGNPYTEPTWAATTTPYNENAALFGITLGMANTPIPSETGNLTLGIWARRTTDSGAGLLIGQGDPAAANIAGVAIAWLNSGAGSLPAIYIGDSTGGPHTVAGDAALTNSTWYFIAATRSTHVWTLYVNAEPQTGTYDDGGTNYEAASGAWIGNVPGSATTRYFTGDLSYGYIFDRALSAAEINTQYVTGISAGTVPAGWVWTNDGDGTFSWQPSTVEVEF